MSFGFRNIKKLKKINIPPRAYILYEVFIKTRHKGTLHNQMLLKTSVFQEPHLDSLQYGEEPLNVSDSFEHDWQISGQRFIGERVFRLYHNGQSATAIVQKYLSSDGDDEAIFHMHILHDDSDKEDLDIHECFAAMEQYPKHFSPRLLDTLNLRPLLLIDL